MIQAESHSKRHSGEILKRTPYELGQASREGVGPSRQNEPYSGHVLCLTLPLALHPLCISWLLSCCSQRYADYLFKTPEFFQCLLQR